MDSDPASAGNAGKASVGSYTSGRSVGAGRYLLKRILGQGGMGVVWLAHDKLLRESVALKFPPQQIAFDPAALAGLRRETLRARKLSHPNIIRIHDLVDVKDEPTFISMEYVDGPNLSQLRARHPSQVLSWKFLAPLLRQLCAALDYAHGEGVVHRDLKPANLMLDSSGRLKLADFGLARVIADSVTRASASVFTSGTVGFMSPQQADGKRPQATDDLYALGVTLYELLTSTPPFYSGDISYQVRHLVPDPLEQRLADLTLSNDIPLGASALVMACLAKDPDKRPPNAKAILQWLDAVETSTAVAPVVAGGNSPTSAPQPREPPAPPPTATAEPAPETFVPENLVPHGEAEPDGPLAERVELASASTETSAQASPWPGEATLEPEHPSRPLRKFAVTAAVLMVAAALALVIRWYHETRSTKSPTVASKPPATNALPPAPVLPTPRSTAPTPPPFAEPGFVSLFNGRDFNGWDGDTNLWFIQDGAITGITAEEGIRRRDNSSLIWRGTVDDFELRLRFRQADMIAAKPANSGVFYRARNLGNWLVRGYQADLFGELSGTLVLVQGEPADTWLPAGFSTLLRTVNNKTIVTTNQPTATAAQRKAAFSKSDWNDLTVIAQGDRLIHKLNGITIADVVDQRNAWRSASGCLALELKRATTVQFKDIRLKRLPKTDKVKP